MSAIVGNIEFYAGPEQVGGPDNLEQVIVDFIDGTKKRLEIAVQELESEAIANAIIRARKRKVIVKIVIEQSYLKRAPAKKDPWTEGGKNESNRRIHNALLRTNIDIKVDYNSSIFHQKFIIRDISSVLTGSTNFTPTGTDKNLNHLVVIHDSKVAKTYRREFREIQQGHFGKLNEGHDPVPPKVKVSGIPIKVLFAPDHNPEMEIMKQMMKARSRIDFAIFTFSQSSGIDDTMLRLLDFNFPISGVFDASQGRQSWSPLPTLANHGARLFSASKKQGIGKLHHKLMVLDDQVIIAGSFNYTGPANKLNDENIIVIGELGEIPDEQRTLQSQLALFARTEIDRIIARHGKKI